MTTTEIISLANRALKEPPKVKPQPDVSDETIITIAKRMAERGFHHNETTIEMTRSYCNGHALYVWGDVGRSKTFYFKTLSSIPPVTDIATGIKIEASFRVIPMMALADKSLDDISEFLERNADREMLIDDVGAEIMPYKFEPLPLILSIREHAHKRTHITTNLSESDLLNRYGSTRIIDRLREGRSRIHCSGPSFRTSGKFIDTSSYFNSYRYEELQSKAYKKIEEERTRYHDCEFHDM